jgi:hypothetical protein
LRFAAPCDARCADFIAVSFPVQDRIRMLPATGTFSDAMPARPMLKTAL